MPSLEAVAQLNRRSRRRRPAGILGGWTWAVHLELSGCGRSPWVHALALAPVAVIGCGQTDPASTRHRQEAGASCAQKATPRAPEDLPAAHDIATPAADNRSARPCGEMAPSSGKPPPTPRPSGPAGMPPATAARTNGTFTRPSAAALRMGTPSAVGATVRHSPRRRVAVLLNDIALGPPKAPTRIEAAITAANTLVRQPYVWGAGTPSPLVLTRLRLLGGRQLRPPRRRLPRPSA